MEPTLLALALTAAEHRATLAASPPAAAFRGVDRRDPRGLALSVLPAPLQSVRRSERPGDSLGVLAPRRPDRCPHCDGAHIQRWGRFGRRQRFRCVDCGRTHSEFTGTAYYRLRRPELWSSFCRCMLESRTVRGAAERTGVHRNTSFRWRHRLLASVGRAERYRLGRCVTVGEGQIYGRVWLLIGLDNRGRCASATLGSRRAVPGDVERLLGDRLEHPAVLLSAEGPFGAVARYARSASVRWARAPASDGAKSLIERPLLYAFRFRRWLHRFYGVAEHYVANYLTWFRLIDRQLWNGLCPRAGGGG